ncbi:hypothetical protein F2Q69_00028608 [Brassica cretica]|uniref:Uncharacterized protein n=1 Tax=Brassica cretica TaxID=69181 RepID=A0A8S9S061_BRACR|nr:hypothetical protein F2Q69_00028608 [Brassica cretica]
MHDTELLVSLVASLGKGRRRSRDVRPCFSLLSSEGGPAREREAQERENLAREKTRRRARERREREGGPARDREL